MYLIQSDLLNEGIVLTWQGADNSNDCRHVCSWQLVLLESLWTVPSERANFAKASRFLFSGLFAPVLYPVNAYCLMFSKKLQEQWHSFEIRIQPPRHTQETSTCTDCRVPSQNSWDFANQRVSLWREIRISIANMHPWNTYSTITQYHSSSGAMWGLKQMCTPKLMVYHHHSIPAFPLYGLA